MLLSSPGHHPPSYQPPKPVLYDSLNNEGLLSQFNLPSSSSRLETDSHQPIHVASSPQLIPPSESDEGLKMEEDTEVRLSILSAILSFIKFRLV